MNNVHLLFRSSIRLALLMADSISTIHAMTMAWKFWTSLSRKRTFTATSMAARKLVTLLGIGGSRGGVTGVATPPHPFQISNIKESNKTKQKIGDNPLEKEEERKSCMFV